MKKLEFRICIAIVNSGTTFRTVASLANELEMTVEEVQQGLDNITDKVRICKVPDKQGNLLYISADQPVTWREYLALLRLFITKHL